MLILDSGAITKLANRSTRELALFQALQKRGTEQPVIPTIVIAECLTGSPTRDARTNQFIKLYRRDPIIPERIARRAAELRTKAGKGSAVDALLVALAEPQGIVLTTDKEDISALAANAHGVSVTAI